MEWTIRYLRYVNKNNTDIHIILCEVVLKTKILFFRFVWYKKKNCNEIYMISSFYNLSKMRIMLLSPRVFFIFIWWCDTSGCNANESRESFQKTRRKPQVMFPCSGERNIPSTKSRGRDVILCLCFKSSTKRTKLERQTIKEKKNTEKMKVWRLLVFKILLLVILADFLIPFRFCMNIPYVLKVALHLPHHFDGELIELKSLSWFWRYQFHCLLACCCLGS